MKLKITDRELSPVHTRNDNYKDNNISVHTSGQYRLFILSAHSPAALNSRARYSKIRFWLGVNVCIGHQLEFVFLKVILTISFLHAFIVIAVVWTLLFFNIFRAISLSL